MDQQSIQQGMEYLISVDDEIAQSVSQLGYPPPRLRPQGFETFLSTIISQQLSTEVAKAILNRVKQLIPEVNPQALLALDKEQLREAGLSYRKIEYAQGLAEAICSNSFSVERLASLDNESAIKEITALRGFGRWSAEIYLMFSLRRTDIFPADDLALQVALQRMKQLDARATPKQARKLTEHWAPWRSVGALYLWHYYRGAPT